MSAIDDTHRWLTDNVLDSGQPGGSWTLSLGGAGYWRRYVGHIILGPM